MRQLFLFFLLSSLFCVELGAKTFSFSQVHAMPQSVEKDYYIWRFLNQQSTTASQAKAIIQDVNNLNQKLQISYKKKTGSLPRVQPKPRPVLKSIAPKQQRVTTQRKREEWKIKSTKLKTIFNSSSPFTQWKSEEPFVQCFVFNKCGSKKRKELNRALTKIEYQRLTTHKSFNQSVPYIMSENLSNLKKALYYTPAKNNALNAQTLSLIAMDALRKGNKKVATTYFDYARRKGGEQSAIDQANFWLYQLTGDKGHLKHIIKANDVNFYALVARDILHQSYPNTITPKLSKRKINRFDNKNPIHWAYLKQKIYQPGANLHKLAKAFDSDETVGVYSYIKSNATKTKNLYFPMPYRSIMSKLPKERQALIYAIAKQESRFVPASVSRSFALGMMQFMPFLIDHVAKERGEKIDYDDIFNPNTAIIYANHHLNYLIKYLYSPLFIAYAYNGGIGFTKRLIQRSDYFRQGKYEPYLSMEKMTNVEAREYGKKVLTNYVIYLNKLGISARISPYLQVLHKPSRTDAFRK